MRTNNNVMGNTLLKCFRISLLQLLHDYRTVDEEATERTVEGLTR